MALLVYMTMADATEARNISQALLERHLVACVNMFPAESLYWWKGVVEQGKEVVCIAKTEDDRFDDLCATVRRLHSYETPCIVALPLTAGEPHFLSWLRQSTRPRDDR